MKNTFGENLKRLRIAKNFTQEQAAQLLNISPKSLSRWECGSTMPDVMMLPEIARLYCVTVDDLYKEHSVAYENYAARLLSVYEASRDLHDFYNAEREFAGLLKSKKYTMNDLRLYGILYQYHMADCKAMALRLFETGLAMGESNASEVYHQIVRQRMLLRSQVGENEKNIEEQIAKLTEQPHDFYCYINLLVAYLYANDNQKALEVFQKAEKEFPDQALLYAYGGDLYKRVGNCEEAFACWDKALSLDSEMTAVLWSKGFCCEEMGEYQKAYEVWITLVVWLEERGYEVEAEEPRKLAERCREKLPR
ncbi:MAG: helix-turn-helix domain-containing protein [Lachnospiraceae bacterium]|nr:helix-turn-helix domain-containing protein [Lachnospiraceae bacterium]